MREEQKEKNKTDKQRKEIERELWGERSFPKRATLHKMLLNKIVHLIRKSN